MAESSAGGASHQRQLHGLPGPGRPGDPWERAPQVAIAMPFFFVQRYRFLRPEVEHVARCITSRRRPVLYYSSAECWSARRAAVYVKESEKRERALEPDETAHRARRAGLEAPHGLILDLLLQSFSSYLAPALLLSPPPPPPLLSTLRPISGT